MLSKSSTGRCLWQLAQLAMILLSGTHPVEGQRRFALLIASGVCDPASPLAHSFVPLAGPPNDVHLMANLLECRYGFRRPDIAVLGLDAAYRQQMGSGYDYLGDQARRGKILKGVAHLKQAGPNDYVFVYYSGHGAPLLDDAEGINTGALVTYECTAQTAIRQKDLDLQLNALASHHVTLVVDACFSGMLAKPAPYRLKGLAELADLPDLMVQEVTKSLPLETQAHAGGNRRTPFADTPIRNSEYRFTTLAACGDDEQTNETNFMGLRDPVAVSEFTWALYRSLWQSQRITTLEDLHVALMQRLRERQQHQTPQFRRGVQRSELIAPPCWLSSALRLPLVSPGASVLSVGRFAGISKPMCFQEEGVRPGIAASHSAVRQVVILHWFDAVLTSGHWRMQPRFVTPLGGPGVRIGLHR